MTSLQTMNKILDSIAGGAGGKGNGYAYENSDGETKR